MPPFNRVLAGTALLLVAINAQAQAPSPATTAASEAQVPPLVAPPVSAPAGASPHGRYGIRYTPGWVDMSSQERDKRRTQMLNARSAEECHKVQAEHHKELAERGRTPLTEPARDPCAGLP